MTWFGVRTTFFAPWADAYEERVTIHRAGDVAEAIEAAEREAREYAEIVEMEPTGLRQAFRMADEPEEGVVVFALSRRSDLEPDDYLDRFFSTGEEMERIIDPSLSDRESCSHETADPLNPRDEAPESVVAVDGAARWFGVRTVFEISSGVYEERVSIHKAASFEDAIDAAEHLAHEYADFLDCLDTGLTQAYWMADELEDGAEVFSLIRRSSLTSGEYVGRFFATGDEVECVAPSQ